MKNTLLVLALSFVSLTAFADTQSAKNMAILTGFSEVKLLTSGTKSKLIKNIKYECQVERNGVLLSQIQCFNDYEIICSAVCSKGKSALLDTYGVIY